MCPFYCSGNKYLNLIPFLFVAAITLSSLITACPGPEKTRDENGAVASGKFNWDTTAREPRWRVHSDIEWYETADRAVVFNESRSSGKPILAYVSSIDSDLTLTIEDGIFPSDMWGAIIREKFIAWEVDRWVSPSMAYEIAEYTSPPGLYVLKPSQDKNSSDFQVLDSWTGQELLKFPLHAEILPLQNPAATEAIDRFAKSEYQPGMTGLINERIVEPDDFAAEKIEEILKKLRDQEGIYPEEALLLAYRNVYYGLETPGLIEHIIDWKDYREENFPEIAFLPNDAFLFKGGWAIDTDRTLQAAIGAALLDQDMGISGTLADWMHQSVKLESGEDGGGFAPIYDIRGTYASDFGYLDDNSIPDSGETYGYDDAVPGPRYTVWANARAISSLIELARADEKFRDAALPDGGKAIELLMTEIHAMLPEMEKMAGEPDSMPLEDKIYLMELYNDKYQFSGSIDLLQKAGAIASTFKVENSSKWFDRRMFPLLPDLALALYRYGWLAEDEDAREASEFIVETAVKYAGGYGRTDNARLAFACDVIDAPSIHISILGPIDDDSSRDLLAVSLDGYDPRRIAQILDPERDAELIEAKGYYAMDDVVAFLCIDDACYPPVKESEELKETIAGVAEDIRNENGAE